MNKPRVFLSYSRKDAKFIERIEIDLRGCQIDSWRDQNEIRDGKPWMSAVFEDGIPTCDAVLVYFSENSLNSQIVAKEVDSAILQQLSDNNIAFLPYVDKDETRTKLRVDIQALQCRAWNDENYHVLLPTIVAEIWRSFLERSIHNAVLHEKNRRLELELELQRIKERSDSPFSGQETSEFQYIYSKLDRVFEVPGTMYENTYNEKGGKVVPGKIVGKYVIRMPLLPVVCSYATDHREYKYYYMDSHVSKKFGVVQKSHELFQENEEQHFSFQTPNMLSELLLYGFVERQQEISSAGRIENAYYFTNQMRRFLFWTDFNGLIPEYNLEIVPRDVDDTS